jgi:Mycothiol maleylpyruvate isomerase N-terminal domain
MPERGAAAGVEELLELVDAEWLRLLSALDRERRAGGAAGRLAGGWSASDVLSHVRLYDAWLLGVLDPPQREEQMPYRSYLTPEAEIHARNRHHVESDRSLPEEEIRSRALDTHSRLREVLARLPDGDLVTPHTVAESRFARSPDGRSLASLVAIETHWHYADHADDLDRLGEGASQPG